MQNFLIYDVVLKKDNSYVKPLYNANGDPNKTYGYHFYEYSGIAFQNIENVFDNLNDLVIYNVKQEGTIIEFSSYSKIPKDHMIAELTRSYFGYFLRWYDDDGNVYL